MPGVVAGSGFGSGVGFGSGDGSLGDGLAGDGFSGVGLAITLVANGRSFRSGTGFSGKGFSGNGLGLGLAFVTSYSATSPSTSAAVATKLNNKRDSRIPYNIERALLKEKW